MVTGVIAMRLTGWQAKLALIVSMCAAGATGVLAQNNGAANATTASDPNHVKAALIVDRMLQMNKQRLAALERYTSERTYRVDYSGTGGEHHAEVKVHAEYTTPEHKQLTIVSESGSKFICEKVLRKLVEGEQEATDRNNRAQTSLGPENYDAVLVGEEVADWPGVEPGTRAWVLKVTPKVDNKFTYKGRIWVSEDDYAVMRIQAEPAKSPSWWINHATLDSRYVRRGDVWLPGKNVSTSHVRIGGEAKLSIDYGTYPVVAAKAIPPAEVTAALRSPQPKVVNASLSASSNQQQ
jgi:hypothetical protein